MCLNKEGYNSSKGKALRVLKNKTDYLTADEWRSKLDSILADWRKRKEGGWSPWFI